MKAHMNAYEENGKFYFEDEQAKVQTNVFGWYELNEEKQDEVDLVLPDGASEVETAAGGRAIELADGQI